MDTKHYSMISVIEQGDNPAPCSKPGLNTIRMMSGKYADIAVGDTVTMQHVPVDSMDSNGNWPEEACLLEERLAVSAVAICSLEQAIADHGEYNHWVVRSAEAWYDAHDGKEPGVDMPLLMPDYAAMLPELLQRCYGEIPPDAGFAVIYF